MINSRKTLKKNIRKKNIIAPGHVANIKNINAPGPAPNIKKIKKRKKNPPTIDIVLIAPPQTTKTTQNMIITISPPLNHPNYLKSIHPLKSLRMTKYQSKRIT